MKSKRRTTFEKIARERKLLERRELKREKKQAAAEARRATADVVAADAATTDDPGVPAPDEAEAEGEGFEPSRGLHP